MIARNTILFACAASLLASSLMAAQPVILQPGLWEITIKTEVSEKITSTTTTQTCMTKLKADHPEPQKSKPADDCQVTGGLNGNFAKYSVKCTRARTTYDAEFTYGGDHYEGVVQYKDDVPLRQVYTAHRLGDCPADE